MQSSFTFELDGETIRVTGDPVFATVADCLDRLGRGKGSRFRQPEPWQGGAPLLMLDADAQNRAALRSVDSSLILLPAAAGRRFWSAEGLMRPGSAAAAHPVISRLREHPDLESTWAGRARLVTALMEAWYRVDWETIGQFTEHFDGCISRGTSHGELRDLALELIAQSRLGPPVGDDGLFPGLGEPMADSDEFSYVDEGKRRFYRPRTMVELARLLNHYPRAVIVGGTTSFANPGVRALTDWSYLISTEGVGDLRTVYDQEECLDIGAAAPLTAVREAIGQLVPALAKTLKRYGTRSIRNRATLGGCLASARSDDEIAPALMALDVVVRAISMDGERDIPVARFFEGNGRTNLRPSEFVSDIIVPKFSSPYLKARGCLTRICDVYKAAPRRSLTSRAVSAGFAVELNEEARVTQAILSYSGVSDRPVRAREVEKALAGKSWSEETVVGVLARLNQEIESSISAAGKSARAALPEREKEYSRQLVITLLQKFYYQHPRLDGRTEDLGAIREILDPERALFPTS